MGVDQEVKILCTYRTRGVAASVRGAVGALKEAAGRWSRLRVAGIQVRAIPVHIAILVAALVRLNIVGLVAVVVRFLVRVCA